MVVHGVAGITVPAFVERLRRVYRQRRAPMRPLEVSPGLRSRPSLSGVGARVSGVGTRARAAGITVPAFVEPGLRSRPSLSAYNRVRAGHGVAGITVPAFVERGQCIRDCSLRRPRVAGITVPAFVERSGTRVAGITVPAFVDTGHLLVSPGLRSRPSLSVACIPTGSLVERSWAALFGRCRRDYGPGLR